LSDRKRKEADAAAAAAAEAAEREGKVYSLEGQLTLPALEKVITRVLNNRTAAYLLVSDGLSEKLFFFPVGAVRMTSVGRRTPFDIDQVLKKHPDLGAAESETLTNLVKEGVDLEEAAQRVGLGKLVRSISTSLIESELFDLVVWPDADYQYRETNPPPQFYNPNLRAIKLSFGVFKLLGRLVNAVDIYQKATRGTRLLGEAGIKPTGTRAKVPGLSIEVQRDLMRLVGRGTTFDALILGMRRKGHNPVEAALALVGFQEAQVLEVDTRRQLSPEARKTRAKQIATDIEGALEGLIHQLVARQRLASAYEEMGDKRRAAQHLKHVALELEERKRDREAVDVYRNILKVTPQDFAVRQRIISAYERLGRFGDVFKEGLLLAREFKKFGLLNRAKNAFRYLINLRRQDSDLRRELIEVLLKAKDKEGAVGELEELAGLYQDKDDRDAFMACQQKILALNPQHEGARNQLTRAIRRTWTYLIPYFGLAAMFLGLVGISWFLFTQYKANEAFGDARTLVYERLEDGDFHGARDSLLTFEASYTVDASRTQELREAIQRQETRHSLLAAADAYGSASALEAKGKLDSAQRKYQTILRSYPNTDWETRSSERLTAIAALREQAGRLQRRLVRLSRQVEENDDFGAPYVKALETAREIVTRFPWSRAAEQVKVPVRIESTPESAWVQINGVDLVGHTTPTVVSRPLVPAFTVTLTKSGFDPQSRTIDLTKEVPALPFRAHLRRRMRWQLRTLGPVVAAPLIRDDGLVIGGSDQRVYRIGRNGALAWSKPLGLFAHPLGTPIDGGEVLVVADDQGNVTAFATEDGSQVWQKSLKGPLTTISRLDARSFAVAASDRVVCLRLEDGEPVWESAPGERIAFAPTYSKDRGTIGYATRQGTFVVIDAATGRPRGQQALNAQPVGPPVDCDTGFCVATDDAKVRMIVQGGSRIAFTAQLPSPATTAPGYGNGRIFVALGAEVIALSAQTGNPFKLETPRLPSPVSAPPRVGSDRAYFATSDGGVYALDARTGQLVWTFATDNSIVGSPVLAREPNDTSNTLFVVSTDYSIYAIRD
jgi:outer membrane protein assembly factor BamB/tetratricopeptide (TPR) repeat protein